MVIYEMLKKENILYNWHELLDSYLYLQHNNYIALLHHY